MAQEGNNKIFSDRAKNESEGCENLAELKSRLARKSHELLETREILERTTRKLEESRRQLDSILSSRAWKLAGPLQKIARRARRAFGRFKGEKARPAMAGNDIQAGMATEKARIGDHGAAFTPKVSVIVPNYNHAPYLRERLDSIYSQSYDNYEVILLDDCSTDESPRILEEYAKKYPEKTRLFINDANSGSPFRQWKKGLDHASGDLVWMAESDDYCAPDFLAAHVGNFADEAVMLSFSPAIFVKNGERIATSAENYAEYIPEDLWRKPWSMPAHRFVDEYFALANLVVNSGSCVMRNVDFNLYDCSGWRDYRLCGDWVLYLNLIRGGRVCHVPDVRSYYRIHEGSTSFAIQRELDYYREHESLAMEIARLYKVEPGTLLRMHEIFRKKFAGQYPRGNCFADCWNLAKIHEAMRKRKINIAIGIYAFVAGGGEILPIALANGLKRMGYPVCVYDFMGEERNPAIRSRLLPNIPVYRETNIYNFIYENAIDIFHTHHRLVDELVASMRLETNSFRHIVTMHGMYEQMENFYPEIAPYMLGVDAWAYVGDGNIAPFAKLGLCGRNFTRIANAVEDCSGPPKTRAEFGIPEDAFVFAICGRGVPEKGWREAIDALMETRRLSGRDVRLMIIGNGPLYDEMKDNPPEGTHFMGLQASPASFLPMADMLLLPSMFRGESFPLVILEAFQAGLPVLASHIGNIAEMIHRDDKWAGWLITLRENKIDARELARLMTGLVMDERVRTSMKDNVPFVLAKYDFKTMCKKYIDLYLRALENFC